MKKLIDNIYITYYKRKAIKHIKKLGYVFDSRYNRYSRHDGNTNLYESHINFNDFVINIGVFGGLYYTEENIEISEYDTIANVVEELYEKDLSKDFDMDKIKELRTFDLSYQKIACYLRSNIGRKMAKDYLKEK